MILVLGDSNPTRHIRRPWVNWGLILLCAVVFVTDPAYSVYGFTPAQLHLALAEPAQTDTAAVALSLVTYMFLHADILHLAGNMLVLWVFGDSIEDAMGHLRYALFFVLAGVAGGLAEGTLGASPHVPVVGASGAIAGVMAAYLLLHPRARLLVLVAFRLPMVIPASLFVGLHVGFDILSVLLPDPEPEALVAFWAHLGGFAAGLGLVLVLRYRDVPLFQPAGAYPEQPFGRLGRWLIDLGHDRDAGSVPASVMRRLVFAVKTVAFFLTIWIAVELLLP